MWGGRSEAGGWSENIMGSLTLKSPSELSVERRGMP